MERTLVLLKPDTIDRGFVGEILQRFERVGLKIAGLKMVQPNEDIVRKHYADLGQRKGEEVLNLVVSMLVSGPVVAICLEGVEAVDLVRKMVGSTEPKSAAPGTIRGDYSHVSYKHADSKGIGIYNLVHASGTIEEAKAEVSVWFNDDELINYKPGYTKHTIQE